MTLMTQFAPIDSLSIFNHRHVVSSASTNSELIDAIKLGTLNPSNIHLLTAETQTAGRGQHERSWQSPVGNVYLSLYHPIHIPISGLLSLIIGVELAKIPVIESLNEPLRAQGLPAIGVKWANDLGFYQPENKPPLSESAQTITVISFNKLAGILIEPLWDAGKIIGVIMGVGLNVAAAPTLTAQSREGMSYQAISLQDIYARVLPDHLHTLPSLQLLYQQVSHALINAITRFEQLAKEQSIAQSICRAQFLQEFDDLDAMAGMRLRVTQPHSDDANAIIGQAYGIDANGCLQLKQDNGKICALFTGRIDAIHST